MEQKIWQGDVHRSTLARYTGLITTSEVEIFREIERMEQNVLISTLAVYVELMAEQEPKPEIDQQLKMVVEYRHMVRNINTEHIKQQIKEELQIKIVKQHKARNHERSKTRPTTLTANTLKSQEDQMVSIESFTQSKKRCFKLVNQKIEKQLTKDETTGRC